MPWVCYLIYSKLYFLYRTKLKVGDAFVGYQEDTPAAVVFQAYHHLKAAKQQEVEDTKSENQVIQCLYNIAATSKFVQRVVKMCLHST